MRYVYLIALATWVAMPTVSTPADEPTADQGLGAGHNQAAPPGNQAAPPGDLAGPPTGPKSRPRPAGVFREDGPIHFRLRSGRLSIDPMRYRKGSIDFSGDRFVETLSVDCSSAVPSVHYRFEDDFQRIQLAAEHGGTLRIDSAIVATGERATLTQHETGKVTLSTRRSPEHGRPLGQHTSGPTLLHIIGRDESGFRVHFADLICRMLRGRDLIVLARRTESYLLDNAERLPAVSRRQVDRLVDQLAAGKSSTRRSAARQLAGMGTAVTPHLTAALARRDLDSEQVARIESLLSRSPRADDDTPASLACLLSADRAHWQMLAERMTRAQWIAANNHIRRCGLDRLAR